MFDRDLAIAFYVDWLGFRLDWEHQYGPDFPKYLQVSRCAAILHLSEHYGDCSPGAKILILTDDVTAYHRELSTRPNPNMRPQVKDAPWGDKIMDMTDPFGNRLCFNQPN